MLTGRHLGLWILLLLAGCAGTGQHMPASPIWDEHRQQLESLRQWTASGKLALRSNARSESASMIWQQRGQDTHLQLNGPLGVGATILHSDGRQLDIRQGDERRTLDISTPDAIARNIGWDLPLLALSYWFKGLPSPDYELQRFELDPGTGLPQHLQQDDWEIRYEQYEQFDGYTLPTRLQIQRGATRAKILISHWQPASS